MRGRRSPTAAQAVFRHRAGADRRPRLRARWRAGGDEMTWTTGTAQVAYAVVRIAGGTATQSCRRPAASSRHRPPSSSTARAAGQFTCYALLPLDTASVIGQSDVLCMVPESASATNAPANARVRLEQGTMATLTWSAPAGQTGFVLWIIPLDGSPQEFLPLHAGAMRVMHETVGHTHLLRRAHDERRPGRRKQRRTVRHPWTIGSLPGLAVAGDHQSGRSSGW